MAVLIDNRQSLMAIPLESLEQVAQELLNDLGSPEGELSLVLVGDDEMADLNHMYRGRTGPTNVLAFAMQEGEFAGVAPLLLGDVVISLPTTQREAEALDIPFLERLRQLLVHGVLHLFGFDHEVSEAEEERMDIRSTELLGRIGPLA